MNPEEKYIQKLEYKIWQLESSKSYRLTYPLRRFEELIGILARLPRAAKLYVSSELTKGFNADSYLASADRPHGWWQKYPRFHYCLFNSTEGCENLKYDGLDTSKPTVILVTHEVSRTGAPILVLDLLNRYRESYNVVVFSIGAGDLLEVYQQKADAFIGPISRSNLGFVLTTELIHLKSKAVPLYAVVNSIVSTEVLESFWRQDIPVIHLVHEFATYTRPLKRFVDSAFYASAMVFSADIVRDNARKHCPQISNTQSITLPQGVCPLQDSTASSENREQEQKAIRQSFRPDNWPENTIVVLGAGTVQLRKGLELFISSAREVVAKLPHHSVRFVWVGAGFDPVNDLRYSCFLDDEIKKSQLGDAFILLDEVKELDEAYKCADIFFLSSKLDPLPLVAQDALSLGLPLVCFEGASGVPEYLKHDAEASFGLVPYLDAHQAAEKIITLIQDPQLRANMGSAGKRVAEQFFNQDKYYKTLNNLGDLIADKKSQEITDRLTIKNAGLFIVPFAYPKFESREDIAISFFTTSWITGIHRRKPLPGFHPGVYAEHHLEITNNPFAHYLESGRKPGPWSTEVIQASHATVDARSLKSLRIALHIHLHYASEAGQILARIKPLEISPDLYISVNTEEAKIQVQQTLTALGICVSKIKIVPNRGRDIGPLFTGFREIFDGRYEFIGHLHGKKSVNLGTDFAQQWALFLYENLLGGREPMADVILNKMMDDSTIGLVFPDDPHVVEWGENLNHAQNLCERMGVTVLETHQHLNFPIGTMFWARTAAMRPLTDLNLSWSDYPEEPLSNDGTILHAIERLLPIVVESQGYRSHVTYVPTVSR